MTSNLTNCRIIVFAKAPIPGEVKTRLLSSMDVESATTLYQKLVLHTLNIAVGSKAGSVELWCSPSKEHPFFLRCAEKFRIELHQQTEGDLGRRMAHAFNEILKRVPMALLIGTDCPSLTSDDLKEAGKALEQESPVVIAPAEDGGYVLIGLRQYEPALFEGISWGTGSVLEETRERLRQSRLDWRELPQQWDVDRPEDVERLRISGLIEYVF
ncbi:MAG: glycosyltransferase [Deltaproteobacteria bacterium]|nr:glycosyltransferase [Deltaproteobacteria bacterium]